MAHNPQQGKESPMAIELFNNGEHVVLGFYDLVDEERNHAVHNATNSW